METVAAITAAGGKVLIPAFALGRAQEILLTLGETQRRGELTAVPIWADGMVRAVCAGIQPLPGDAAVGVAGTGRRRSSAGQIQPVTTAAQRNALIWEPGPAVIVSSSGMLAGGPSVAYARALAGQPAKRHSAHRLPGRGSARSPPAGDGDSAVAARCGWAKTRSTCSAARHLLPLRPRRHRPACQLCGDARPDPGLPGARRRRRAHEPGRGAACAWPPRPPAACRAELRLPVYAPWCARRPRRVSAAGGGPMCAACGRRLPALHSEQDDIGARFTLATLAQSWWGAQPGPTPRQLAELAAALAADACYFAGDPSQAGAYRLRSRDQVELTLRRRAQLAAYGDADRSLAAGAQRRGGSSCGARGGAGCGAGALGDRRCGVAGGNCAAG